MRERFSPLLPLLVASAIAACGPPGTVAVTDRADISQRVHGQLGVWTRAVNNRSLDTLALLYRNSPDVSVVWPDGEKTRGAKDIAARWSRWAGSLSQLNFVSQNAVVDIVDREVAIATFFTVTDAVAGTARSREAGRATQVWALDRTDGRWRIVAEHRSAIPARE
jgi:ketosteroid isomerase-like protein